jgi:hypothetical protein
MSLLLQVTRSIENDIWSMTFSVDRDKISQTDTQLISKFGEPTINVGGTFGSTPNQFTLPAQYIGIVSELPYTRTFDSNSAPFNVNTQLKAQAYQDAIVASYTSALGTLRAQADTFTGEYLFNL